MAVSSEIGEISALTAVATIVTGIMGAVLAMGVNGLATPVLVRALIRLLS
jgi:putative effector of murein hydrolase